MKSRRKLYCTNCKEGMPKQYVFQGVIICEKCHAIVSRCVERARRELEMLFLTYTDMMRVALVKGEMNFPSLPKGTRMPRGAMEAALQEAAKRIGGMNGEGPATEGQGAVHPLRGSEVDSSGKVPDRGHSAAVPRRGDVRDMSGVQETGVEDRQCAGGDTHPSEGVEVAEVNDV